MDATDLDGYADEVIFAEGPPWWMLVHIYGFACLFFMLAFYSFFSGMNIRQAIGFSHSPNLKNIPIPPQFLYGKVKRQTFCRQSIAYRQTAERPTV